MKIKFDWGTGIVIALVMIVLFMGTLVYIATRQDFYLVDDDYYEQGVKYQQHIEKRQNSGQLSEPVQLAQIGEELQLQFPVEFQGKEINGTIHFYSPANKSNDFKSGFRANESRNHSIKISNLKKGRYIVKIDWKTESKAYYFEQSINIR